MAWARCFDRQLDDVLTLRGEIAVETAAQIDPEFLIHEGERLVLRGNGAARDRAQSQLFVAYKGYLAALGHLRRDGEAPGHWLACWSLSRPFQSGTRLNASRRSPGRLGFLPVSAVRWLGDLDSNQGCPAQSREFYR